MQARVLGWIAPVVAVMAVACGGGGASTPSSDLGSGGGGGNDGGASVDSGTPSSSSPDAGSSSSDAGSSGELGGDSGFVLPADGGAPDGFWDAGTIPAAQNVMTFVFLNRTNGKLGDANVYWSFISGSISETHAIADQPTYDMPANSSGRMYFYLCMPGDTACAAAPTKSPYFDFIEFTIGPAQFNGNTTRVDAFGIKIAMRLHCSDGFDVAVGEDYETFLEDRTATFDKFVSSVPAEFQPLAQAPNAPYRIVEPGAGSFNTGGANADYYDSYESAIWSANGITIAMPGPNGSGLGSYPDLSAAIMRHVGATAGSFNPDGTLLDKTLWNDPTTFYTAAPYDAYAQFWHEHALGGKAYGFPYDDVGGYSSYVSHANPQYMLVALGW